ncbi:TPA: hypothetical protein DEB00_02230 [Candidatus Uhrbacteria bacterium]|nr:hypothetical protein [Candidatus Uhrbacteria bacterium]
MKLTLKNRRVKRTLSPKQAAVVIPLIGMLLTCVFGWLFYRDVLLYTDHQIIRADVVSVERRHVSNKTRDHVRVSFEINEKKQTALFKRRIYTKPLLAEGDTVEIAVHENWPQYVLEVREGWKARLLFASCLALLVVGTVDVIAIKVLKPYLPKRPPTL